jgi:hypothetical protein
MGNPACTYDMTNMFARLPTMQMIRVSLRDGSALESNGQHGEATSRKHPLRAVAILVITGTIIASFHCFSLALRGTTQCVITVSWFMVPAEENSATTGHVSRLGRARLRIWSQAYVRASANATPVKGCLLRIYWTDSGKAWG